MFLRNFGIYGRFYIAPNPEEHNQGDNKLSKPWYVPVSPQGFMTQKNDIDIFTAVRISKPPITFIINTTYFYFEGIVARKYKKIKEH
jgi:hypothetical protein